MSNRRFLQIGLMSVSALLVVVMAEWLRDQLFTWSVGGAVSVLGMALTCLLYVCGQIRPAPSGRRWGQRLAATITLVAAIGLWSLWARWLNHGAEALSHRTVLPIGVCLLTSWLLLEWATSLVWRGRSSGVSPLGPRATVLWPVVGFAVDLWLRLFLKHGGLGAFVVVLWALNRYRPVLRTAWSWMATSRWGIVILLVLACVLRAAFAWRLEHAGLDPAILDGPDSGYYHAAATALATGHASLWQPTWLLYPRHNPGPTLVYAGLYALVGPHVWAARVVQVLLGVWSCLLIYGIGRRLFNDAVARVATFLVAGRGYLIAYGSYLGTETLGLFFAALCVWWWLCLIQDEGRQASRARRMLWIVGSGIAASWLMMTRPEFLPLPIVVGLLSWWKSRPRTWARWVVIVGLSLSLPVCWTIRNGVVFGVWRLQAHPGVIESPRLETLGVLTHDEVPTLPADAPTDHPILLPAHIEWQRVLRNPMGTLIASGSDAAEKITFLWSWRRHVFIPALVYVVREEPFMVFVSLVLAVGLLVGVWTGRHAHPGLYLLYSLMAVKTLVHAATAIREWHRFTMEPFVNILEAAGFVAIVSWVVKQGRGQQSAPVLVAEAQPACEPSWSTVQS